MSTTQSTQAMGETLVFPCSFAQERLWVLHQVEEVGAAYHVPTATRMRGPLDAGALARALGALVRRHEALRTTLAAGPDGPVQRVHPPAPVALPSDDLSHLAPQAREAEARRIARDEAERPFDLAAGPLFRARLVRLAQDEHLLVIVAHHAVSDGLTFNLLFRELGALYDAAFRGGDAGLQPLEVQYADFAVWQREWLAGDTLREELEWWPAALAGAPHVLPLPMDRPRAAARSYRGAVHRAFLPAQLAESVRELARREGATPFMVLLASFQALLARLSGEAEVVVGSPAAGRSGEEVEGVAGFFANLLPLRGDLSGDPSFRALLGRVREATLGAFAHADTPLDRIVEALRVERAAGAAPLVQAVFSLHPGCPPAPRIHGVRCDTEWVHTGTSKFDLTLEVAEAEGGYAVSWEYASALFDARTVAVMAERWTRLLAAALADPDARVSALPLLDAAERVRVVAAGRGAQAPYERDATIHALFAQAAARTPDAVALAFEEETVTYGELERRANRLARHLAGLGVGGDTPVAVCLERGPALVTALLAVLKAGGAYVPLDASYPPERLLWMLADTAAPVLVTEAKLRDLLPTGAMRIVSVDEDAAAIAARADTAPESGAGPESLAYVVYTSGSTGRPKGVCVPHRAVVRLVRATDFARMGVDEVFLMLAPVSFDAATLEVWGPLLNGARLAIAPPRTPSLEEIGGLLRRHGVTTLWLTAGLFHQLAAEDPAALGGLRQLLAGGDVLSPAHVRGVLRALPGLRLINGYGPTENTTFSCCHTVREADLAGGTVPIGRPIAHSTAHVLDGALNPVPAGVTGELYVGGDGVARGYLNRPAETAARFVPDPFSPVPGARLYRTGDRVRMRAGGALEFVGRADQQVKVRGHRVEPGEVEAALLALGARDAVAIAREDVPGDRRLVAYVVPPEGEMDPAALRIALRERLPEPMVPSAVVVLERLPLTANGKVDRRALPAPEVRGDADARPRTPAEEVLAAIWARVLGAARVGIHDSFFDLGGHSLLATQVVSRIRAAFGVELPLRALFEAPTVEALATRLAAGERGEAPPPLTPAERTGPAALSSSQERLWFMERMAPGAGVYHVPLTLSLSGSLDGRALQAALDEVVRRHEALRTVFTEVDGGPVQRVLEPAPFALEREDLRALDPAAREAAAAARLTRGARAPFDLARGPLARGLLLRLADQEHVLLLVLHHAVTDGWSTGVLLREMEALYGAFARGEPSPLAPLPVQYADYAAWQHGWLRGQALERQLAWWTERLRGAPDALELPADRPRPAVRSYRGGVHRFALSAEVREEVTELARRLGATPFMVLLAAWKALLARYAGETDVVVGTPVAGRRVPELEALIGFFVNTLALRTDLGGDPTFEELVLRVRETTLGAFAHPDLPFERLVGALGVSRDVSRSPVFQVMFALNAPAAPVTLPGLSVRPRWAETGAARFDLTLGLEETADGWEALAEYATDLFDGATVERMAAHWRTLLRAAVADPSRRLADLPLMSPREWQTALRGWNDTARPYPLDGCIHHGFEAQADRTPDAVAVVFEGRSITYAELEARANRLAHHLRGLGVGPEDRVGVCLERSVEMVVALYAVLKAGGAYVPLDPGYPPDRLAYLLADAAVPVLVTDARLAARLPAHGARTVRVDAEAAAIAAASATRPEGGAGPDHLAYVIYTSGSTGRPKGAMNAHCGVINRLLWMQEALALEADEAVLQKTPFSFDVSVWEFFWPLMTGARLVVARPEGHRDPAYLAEVIAREGITTLHFVPSMLRLFLEAPEAARCRGLRRVVCSGEALAPDLRDRFHALLPGTELHNLYGPTEAAVDATWWPCVPEKGGRTVPIGRPVANTQVHVLDGRGQPVPPNVAGELFLGGVQVGRGYLGRPALTAERFIPDPFSPTPGARLYRTGDLCRRTAEGVVEYIGRTDFQVKVRGFRIELGEIEAALAELPAVRECAVAALGAGEAARLVAWVVPAEGAATDPSAMRETLRRTLPEWMVPSAIVPLEALPLSPNGKLDRRRLPQPAEAPAAAAWEAPAEGAEAALAEIWREVLGRERVGRDDSFFDLGGQSLLLARVRTRIAQRLGVELPMVELFQYPTVRGMAARLERGAAGPEPSAAGEALVRERMAGRERLRRRTAALEG
jgi:amino acid adenylation domain-containing protein